MLSLLKSEGELWSDWEADVIQRSLINEAVHSTLVETVKTAEVTSLQENGIFKGSKTTLK